MLDKLTVAVGLKIAGEGTSKDTALLWKVKGCYVERLTPAMA